MIDINKAKQKILDLAIRGKLTKQLKSDGNAVDLLVEIQKEKEKLIKDKKIRNDTNVISDDIEEPFEIPENWVWCKIGEIGIYKKGPFGSSLKKSLFVEKSKDTIKVYEQQNAINHNSELGKYYISKEYFESKMKGFEVFSGDLIVSCAGTIGEIYLMPERIERGIINQALMKISLFNGIDKQYFIKYFDYSLKQSASEGNGSAIINIPPFEVLKNYVMPLPPLAEQNRIVEKVGKLFEILDKIDEAQKKYQKDKETLKSKIIEAGIRGKLTKQLKSDGNASVLLDEIRKEKEKLIKEGKIKRDKKETYIYKKPKDNLYYEKHQDGTEKCIQDELPFEIPENWVWCRLGNIGRWGSGATPLTSNSKYYDKGTIPWILTGDLNDSYILTASHYITEKALNDCSLELREKGSVLIAMYGATIGKLAILEIDATMNQACCACTVYKGINNKWLYYFLMCNKTSFVRKGSGGAQPNISKEKITQTEVPLPPHAEQERIVEQIEELLTSIVS